MYVGLGAHVCDCKNLFFFFLFFFLFLNFIDAHYTLKFRLICDDILLLIKFLNIDGHYFDKGFKQIVNVLLCAVLCNCKKLGESEGRGGGGTKVWSRNVSVVND